MTDDHPAQEDARGPDAYLAWLRYQAVAWQRITDDLTEAVASLREAEPTMRKYADQLGTEPDALARLGREMTADIQQTRLTGELDAAEARAYEQLLAEGGPDNAEALQRYREASEMHAELLPRRDTRHEPGSPTG